MRTKRACAEGGLVLHEVIEPVDRQELLGVLHRMTGESGPADPRMKFPGPSPVSIERANFQVLRQQRYVICEKTDGWRAALMLCQYKEWDFVVLWDRKLTPYLLDLYHVPVALWQGSLFDGEVVHDKSLDKWTFLVFDAVRIAGAPVWKRPLHYRVGIASTSWRSYRPEDGDTLIVRVKKFLPAEDVQALPGHLANVRQQYETDGLVLTPDEEPVVFGRHWGMFKLKTKHSVDFLVDEDGVGLLIYCPSTKGHARMGRLISARPGFVGAVVECTLKDRVEGVWDLVMVRTDKKTANDRLTFEKTMLNMEENITMEEICTVLARSN